MKKFSILKCAITVVTGFLMSMAISGNVSAASWYVSPSGSDSNSGTYSSPFASLNKAEDAASSGDTVYIMGGTYKNFTIEQSAGKPA